MNKIIFSNKFRQFNLYIGSVESFTGGLFASEIVSVPGASNYFKGSLVTYSNEEKINLLGIDKKRVDKYGVVSKEVASDMATFGKNKLNVDVCVSFTGNAGPDVMENKKVGQIYIGIAYFDKIEVYSYILKGNRSQIRKEAINISYQKILEIIKKFTKNY